VLCGVVIILKLDQRGGGGMHENQTTFSDVAAELVSTFLGNSSYMTGTVSWIVVAVFFYFCARFCARSARARVASENAVSFVAKHLIFAHVSCRCGNMCCLK